MVRMGGRKGNPMLWFVAFFGAFITAAYTTRMMIVTFYGEPKTEIGHLPGKLMTVPLVVLAIFSLIAGFIELPHNFGHFTLFSDLLSPVFPATELRVEENTEWLFQLLAVLATFGGVYLSYIFYYKQPYRIEKLRQSALANGLYNFWFSGWGFDRLYNSLFVGPFVFISGINKNDVVDKIYTGISAGTNGIYRLLSDTQTGSLRWYIMGMVIGAIVVLGLQIIL